jgi:beta-galactosidase GanA
MNVSVSRFLRGSALLIGMLAVAGAESTRALSDDASLPHIVQKDGRYALLVDGAPYLILGAQVNNSSAWPAMLPKVWPAMEFLHVNTVEIPVYWEQFEPQPGQFDYSVIDALLSGAREHKLHLVVLWFATWKNGSNHYQPQWMKLDPERYPNTIGRDGKFIDSPSPHAEATLQADIKAFSAFLQHLKEADPQHTVLMVQVENEPGMWGGTRDYSPAAQKAFDSPVPSEALAAMHKPDGAANWKEAFGENADEFFQVWHVARFIGQVAAAGKAVYPLPLYVNAAVRDPINPGRPPRYEVGGPNDNVFDLWKAAAPAIDLLAPDIYQRDTANYLKLLDVYRRADNPLFVPETIGQGAAARFLFAALGRGAIGYAPFGMDYTRSFSSPNGDALTPDEVFRPTAVNYQMIGPMASEIARLNFEGKLQTAVQEEPEPDPAQLAAAPPSQGASQPPARILHCDGWDTTIHFGTFTRSGSVPHPQGAEPDGRILLAQLSENQFLVAGLHSRISFYPTGKAAGKPWQYLAVEEGLYDDGAFKAQRTLNGDQTDWGLVFSTAPTVLRVSLYTR